MQLSKRWHMAAMLIVTLLVSPAMAGSISSLDIFSDEAGSTEGLGSFAGSITYDTDGLLDIDLTNTSTPANGGFITGLVFNIAADATASFISTTADASFAGVSDALGAPYGTFEFGSALGGNFLGGGKPTGGVAQGETETFSFQITGPGIASLTALDFIADLSTGADQSALFLVRFRGFADGGSDKVPGIPTPTTAALSLAMIGAWALRRTRTTVVLLGKMLLQHLPKHVTRRRMIRP